MSNLIGSLTVGKVALGSLTVSVLAFALSCFYNIFLHPLRSYPGSKLWTCSTLMQSYHMIRGTHPFAVKALHDKYGEIVRIGPNELVYLTEDAWDAIYGHIRGKKTKNYAKDHSRRSVPDNLEGTNIINAGESDHRRMRRLQSHAFSEKSLMAQEPILQHYARQFVAGLRKQLAPPTNGRVAMNDWFHFTTFDVIGDLSFGESFHCVEKGVLDPWISTILNSIKAGAILTEISRYLKLGKVEWLIPRSLKQVRVDHFALARAKAQQRIDTKTDRPDFLGQMLKHFDSDKGMTMEEVKDASNILIAAGSETTASLLTGLSYHFMLNPVPYAKAKAEVREAFSTAEEMTLQNLISLPYLNACISEALRLFPPAPDTFPRLVPEGGDHICGRYVPEGTTVGLVPWATGHSELNFKNPDSFVPERWLGDPLYASDRRGAHNAFSHGPRNCIGKNLAYAEARLLAANLLYHFDMHMPDESWQWVDGCRSVLIWDKPDLWTHLTDRA